MTSCFRKPIALTCLSRRGASGCAWPGSCHFLHPSRCPRGRVVEKVKESQTASLPRLCPSPPEPLSCPPVRSGSPWRRPCGTAFSRPSPVWPAIVQARIRMPSSKELTRIPKELTTLASHIELAMSSIHAVADDAGYGPFTTYALPNARAVASITQWVGQWVATVLRFLVRRSRLSGGC